MKKAWQETARALGLVGAVALILLICIVLLSWSAWSSFVTATIRVFGSPDRLQRRLEKLQRRAAEWDVV